MHAPAFEGGKVFIIKRPDGYAWGKRGYWTLVNSNVKRFRTESQAKKFAEKEGMIDRLKERNIPAEIIEEE